MIYEKRRHALMGERIGMDITNIIWDRVVSIIERNDYVGCKEQFLQILAMEVPFTEEDFENTERGELEERAFQEAMAAFKRKTDRIQSDAYPVIKDVYENQGNVYQFILIPITDGRHVVQLRVNLKEAYETEAKNIVREFEKFVVLHIIDDDWKENLRQLDELRHSVQNASYEQKDPLLVFKLESAKLWDSMIDDMNNRIASFLTRGQIPMQQAPVQEAQPVEHQQRYNEQKVNLDEQEEAQRRAAMQDTREGAAQEQRREPIVREKMPRPNDPCPCGSGKKFPLVCRATVGVVGNVDHSLVKIGKAGRKRHMGIRPTVRGSVMNPNDHPHGGGEGKTGIGRPGPSTPWGKPALGLKTRKSKKASNKLIVRRRDGRAIK